MSAEIGFDAQTPSLPAGGGAMTGLGETFTTDLATGTGSYSVPLDCPAGPNGIAPKLALAYSTAAGNGPFGMGWNVALPRLLRSTVRGAPTYDTGDELMLEGSGELVALPDGTLRPRVDAGAWRAARENGGFRLTDREGVNYLLGTTAAARLSDPARSDKVYAWQLEKIEDALGNAATVQWHRERGQLYLFSIAYGVYELRFIYGPRPDVVRWGRAGFPLITGLRCTAIELHVLPGAQSLVRRWRFDYSQAGGNGASLLTAVTLAGFSDGNTLEAPPLTLGYSTFQTRALTRFTSVPDAPAPGPLNRPDRRVELIDWHGDGLPDLLEIGSGGRARVWPNAGECTWGRPQVVAGLPQFASSAAAVAFVDMDGDGVADGLRMDRPLDGFIPRVPGSGFGRPVAWRTAPSVAPASPQARLVDLDGDGRLDLLASTSEQLLLYYRRDPDGWEERPQTVARRGGPDVGLEDPHVFVADMTGDGGPDLVRVDGSGVTCWPYLGSGRWDAPVRMGRPDGLPFDFRPERLFVNDIDGDGCADLVYLDQGRVHFWINQTGTGFGERRTIDFVPTGQIVDVRMADMRGSGTAGLLWSIEGPLRRGAAYLYLDFTGGAKPNLLHTIDNGLGLTSTIEYTTSAREAARDAREGRPWATFLPIAVPIVSSIEGTDATTGLVSRTEFRFHEGRYDAVLREFAGFARVDQDEIGDTTAPTLRTTTTFHVGLDPESGVEPKRRDDRHRLRAIRGRIVRRERFGLDGSPVEHLPYDRVEHTWIVVSESTAAGAIVIPRLKRTVRTVIERSTSPSPVITIDNVAWDAFGNVAESIETTEIPGDLSSRRTLRTVTAFAIDPADRFRSRVSRVQQFDAAGARVSDTITRYDGLAEGRVGPHGLITERSSLAITDALAAEVFGVALPPFAMLGYHRRAGDAGWWVRHASYEREENATGLRGRITGPRGATTSFVFDVTRTYPIEVRDARGNTVTAEFNPRVGRVRKVTDAAGATCSVLTDPLARITGVVRPGDTDALPTESFEYSTTARPTVVTRRQLTATGTTAVIEHREMHDGVGRLLERRVRDDGGEVILETRSYGMRGQPSRVYLEERVAGPGFTLPALTRAHATFTYDALGRAVRLEHPDGSVRQWRYGPLEVEERDEENTPVRRRFDAAGNLRTIEQAAAGALIASHYEHDLKGRLIRHTDAAGHVVRMWFDLLGRPIRTERAEAGTVMVLDASGNAVESRTRDGTAVLREFDECDRQVAVRFTAGGAPAIAYTYHDSGRPAPADAGAHTRGRCVRVEDESGVTTFEYDARGRVARKRSRPAGTATTFQLDYKYRTDGNLQEITYPQTGAGRQVVRYEYNRRGLLARVPSVVSALEYDLRGRRTRCRYANGVEETMAYDGRTARLRRLTLSGPGGVVHDLTYTTDGVGNVRRIDSPDPTRAVSYTYDDRYQLTAAAADDGDTWSYRYDAAGNLTFKSDVGNYRYGEGGAPATCLTSVGTDTFAYTPGGRLDETPWGRLSFDPLGRLTSITKADGRLEFTYDHLGQRAGMRGTGSAASVGTRTTPDTLYAIENGELVLHLSDLTRIVGRVTASGTAFLHADHLGGVVAVTDVTGGVVDTIRYDPYGQVIERTGAGAPQPFGFTGGSAESWSGLLYLQARYYHPAIGRFISADAIVTNAADPVAWSLFVYCRNNPVTYIDPTGYDAVASILAGIGIALLIVALAVASVLTAGALTPLMVAVGIGVLAGGIVGGVAAYRRGGSLEDVVTGTLVGMAVGGWLAFGGYYASVAVVGALGQGLTGSIAAGAVGGAINGAGMGFTTGYAGGKGTLEDMMINMLAGALTGAAVGAAIGALSHVVLQKPPSGSVRAEQGQSSVRGTPAPPATGTGGQAGPPPAPEVHLQNPSVGDIGGKLAPKAADYAFTQFQNAYGQVTTAEAVSAPFFANIGVQTVFVDLLVGSSLLVVPEIVKRIQASSKPENYPDENIFKSPKGKWG